MKQNLSQQLLKMVIVLFECIFIVNGEICSLHKYIMYIFSIFIIRDLTFDEFIFSSYYPG